MHVDTVITWSKNKKLDTLYNNLREYHFAKDHRLKYNYDHNHLNEVSAKSIYWNTKGEPEILCSILARPCWPKNVYRILNRLWKVNLNSNSPFSIQEGFGKLVLNQLEWCKNNNAEAVFMSRQTNHWQSWASKHIQEQTNIKFLSPREKFLTCTNDNDLTCWQKILFYGNENILNNWRKK